MGAEVWHVLGGTVWKDTHQGQDGDSPQGEQGAGRGRVGAGVNLQMLVTESPGAGNSTIRMDGHQRN